MYLCKKADQIRARLDRDLDQPDVVCNEELKHLNLTLHLSVFSTKVLRSPGTSETSGGKFTNPSFGHTTKSSQKSTLPVPK